MNLTTITQALMKRTEILFSVFFLVVVAMMVLPLPTFLIDLMIGFNLSFAFIILITTIYLRTALDISTFPALILIGTVFRLAITISTTRLILAEGYAGEIITAFGNFVVSGNVVVGLVVFLIVALVQFIVVTKGAERIAEVSARFTLDAMPGKQLAIDSDLRNGHITAQKALKRREQLELESQFFGAMDGALRFVKGDAIASLVVVAVNLIGGLSIGMFQRGMSFSESAHHYSLLTIGEGLVSQIPSMLMAIAAGTVVTRVSSEDAVSLGSDIGRQLSQDSRALGVAGAMTFSMGFVPGFPALVLWPLGLLLGAGAYWVARPKKAGAPRAEPRAVAMERKELDRARFGDPIVVTVSEATLQRLDRANFASILEARISSMAHVVGVAVTVPTFNPDPRIADHIVHIQVENVPVGVLTIEPDADLDLMAFSLCRIVRRHVGPTFSVEDVMQWLTSVEQRLGRLAVEVRENVPQIVLVKVARQLLTSGVTLSQPRAVLEVILERTDLYSNPEQLAEAAREAIGSQVAYGMLDYRGVLPLIPFESQWVDALDRYFASYSSQSKFEAEADLEAMCRSLPDRLLKLNESGIEPVGLIAREHRSATQFYLSRHRILLPLISEDEILADISCEMLEPITLVRREDAQSEMA